jgi:hypothetical protein
MRLGFDLDKATRTDVLLRLLPYAAVSVIVFAAGFDIVAIDRTRATSPRPLADDARVSAVSVLPPGHVASPPPLHVRRTHRRSTHRAPLEVHRAPPATTGARATPAVSSGSPSHVSRAASAEAASPAATSHSISGGSAPPVASPAPAASYPAGGGSSTSGNPNSSGGSGGTSSDSQSGHTNGAGNGAGSGTPTSTRTSGASTAGTAGAVISSGGG